MERTQKHSLVAMITIAILAMLSGADGFVAIVTYGKAFASVAGDVFRIAQWDSVTRYLWSGVGPARPPGARNEFPELGELHY
ncbi:MAG: transposase family protein [Moorea sp. SIO2I5]|nr:transposase family protein [Moorena sp. SIO2I5]